MAWTTPTSRTTGTLITASIWNTDLVDNLIYLKVIADAVDGYSVVRKTADETVNNSNAFQSDNELLFGVAASAVYEVELWLLASAASATPAFKFQWSLPAGATAYMAGTGDGGNTAIGAFGVTQGVPSQLGTFSTIGVGAGAVNPFSIALHAKLIISTTPGTATLQWAQNTAHVSDSKILTNSSLIIHKLT